MCVCVCVYLIWRYTAEKLLSRNVQNTRCAYQKGSGRVFKRGDDVNACLYQNHVDTNRVHWTDM